MKTAKRKPKNIDAYKGTIRNRISRLFRRYVKMNGKYTFSMGIIACLVFLYAVVVDYRRIHDPAQLKFVENPSVQTGGSDIAGIEPIKPVLSGEAYETAQRLRESGALLMAVSLSSFDEFRVNSKFPATVGEVFSGLQKRSLLPPGIELMDGSLRSAMSEMKLNYRVDPFSFEIISSPVSESRSPAFIFRFPLPAAEANSIMYFQSSPGKPPNIPNRFSTPEQLAAAGWNITRWRGEALPLDESTLRDLREQEAWLKSVSQGKK